MNGKRKMNYSNAKESFTPTWLEYRFLSMFHLIISNVQEPKWQEFVRNQLTEHYIAAIQEEMFNLTITSIYRKEHFEENLFKFSSLCTRTAWLRLFDWAFLRLDPYWKCDVTGRKATHLIIDTEPQPPPIDSWTCGKALQTFVQKSSLPTLVSPSSTIAATRSVLNCHEKSKNTQQVEAAKSKSIKMKELQETKGSTNNKAGKTKKTAEVLSKPKKLVETAHRQENKIHFVRKISNPIRNTRIAKKQQDVTDTRQLK
ncbi:hypothetical protein ANTPLA_LOCUS6642 [Anthophora plagiata]